MPELNPAQAQQQQDALKAYGELPSTAKAFAPILLPITFIYFGSIVAFPSKPLGEGLVAQVLSFFGQPIMALLIGLVAAFFLLKGKGKATKFNQYVSDGLIHAAPIILITGAGGAFGAILKITPLGTYLGDTLSALGIGLFMPFMVAAALKTAQGSTTVALVATSALVAPMLTQLGLDSEMGRVLTVMAIGAGAMTVSHANDSFFWVVSQFSRMKVATAYQAQTMATLVQGISAMAMVWLLSLVFL